MPKTKSRTVDTQTGAPNGVGSSRILVVEDSPTQAQLLRNTLEADGFEVAVAVDGAKGLELFNASAFALVISDILMPGLSGYELC